MTDDIDAILDDDGRVEARFRDLEVEAKIEELRRKQGIDTPPKARTGDSAPAGDDPLADLKASLDGSRGAQATPSDPDVTEEVERVVLAICPHCDAKNRISLTKLRTGDPKCGRCKKPLAFTRS